MASYKNILTSLGNRPTRRSLFGPLDREQLQQEYQNALRKDLAEATQRWGFDFMSEKPLKGGDFHWEGVPGTKVPLIYRPCLVGLNLNQVEGQRKEEGVRAGPSPSGKENIPSSPERYGDWKLENTPKKRGENKLKRKQTNITDFYAAKRRAGDTPRKSGL